MNVHYWIRRALRRPTCILDRGAALGPKAKILNARDRDEHIRIGRNSIVLGELFVFAHGGEIQIGEECFIDQGTRIWSAQSISIGHHVRIGPDVNVFDSWTHPLSARERHEQIKQIFTTGHPKSISLDERAVVIGSHVQIGAGAIILRGVTVGDGAIVRPREIVTKDIT